MDGQAGCLSRYPSFSTPRGLSLPLIGRYGHYLHGNRSHSWDQSMSPYVSGINSTLGWTEHDSSDTSHAYPCSSPPTIPDDEDCIVGCSVFDLYPPVGLQPHTMEERPLNLAHHNYHGPFRENCRLRRDSVLKPFQMYLGINRRRPRHARHVSVPRGLNDRYKPMHDSTLSATDPDPDFSYSFQLPTAIESYAATAQRCARQHIGKDPNTSFFHTAKPATKRQDLAMELQVRLQQYSRLLKEYYLETQRELPGEVNADVTHLEPRRDSSENWCEQSTCSGLRCHPSYQRRPKTENADHADMQQGPEFYAVPQAWTSYMSYSPLYYADNKSSRSSFDYDDKCDEPRSCEGRYFGNCQFGTANGLYNKDMQYEDYDIAWKRLEKTHPDSVQIPWPTPTLKLYDLKALQDGALQTRAPASSAHIIALEIIRFFVQPFETLKVHLGRDKYPEIENSRTLSPDDRSQIQSRMRRELGRWHSDKQERIRKTSLGSLESFEQEMIQAVRTALETIRESCNGTSDEEEFK